MQNIYKMKEHTLAVFDLIFYPLLVAIIFSFIYLGIDLNNDPQYGIYSSFNIRNYIFAAVNVALVVFLIVLRVSMTKEKSKSFLPIKVMIIAVSSILVGYNIVGLILIGHIWENSNEMFQISKDTILILIIALSAAFLIVFSISPKRNWNFYEEVKPIEIRRFNESYLKFILLMILPLSIIFISQMINIEKFNYFRNELILSFVFDLTLVAGTIFLIFYFNAISREKALFRKRLIIVIVSFLLAVSAGNVVVYGFITYRSMTSVFHLDALVNTVLFNLASISHLCGNIFFVIITIIYLVKVSKKTTTFWALSKEDLPVLIAEIKKKKEISSYIDNTVAKIGKIHLYELSNSLMIPESYLAKKIPAWISDKIIHAKLNEFDRMNGEITLEKLEKKNSTKISLDQKNQKDSSDNLVDFPKKVFPKTSNAETQHEFNLQTKDQWNQFEQKNPPLDQTSQEDIKNGSKLKKLNNGKKSKIFAEPKQELMWSGQNSEQEIKQRQEDIQRSEESNSPHKFQSQDQIFNKYQSQDRSSNLDSSQNISYNRKKFQDQTFIPNTFKNNQSGSDQNRDLKKSFKSYLKSEFANFGSNISIVGIASLIFGIGIFIPFAGGEIILAGIVIRSIFFMLALISMKKIAMGTKNFQLIRFYKKQIVSLIISFSGGILLGLGLILIYAGISNFINLWQQINSNDLMSALSYLGLTSNTIYPTLKDYLIYFMFSGIPHIIEAGIIIVIISFVVIFIGALMEITPMSYMESFFTKNSNLLVDMNEYESKENFNDLKIGNICSYLSFLIFTMPIGGIFNLIGNLRIGGALKKLDDSWKSSLSTFAPQQQRMQPPQTSSNTTTSATTDATNPTIESMQENKVRPQAMKRPGQNLRKPEEEIKELQEQKTEITQPSQQQSKILQKPQLQPLPKPQLQPLKISQSQNVPSPTPIPSPTSKPLKINSSEVDQKIKKQNLDKNDE